MILRDPGLGDDRRLILSKSFRLYSDQLIGELRSADVIVLGLPMYNFGVKAYFAHIARAGVTFRYTKGGYPVGLLPGGKQAYVFAARGGLYGGMPYDTQTPYVRHFLGFLGIADVQFIYAEGLNITPAMKGFAEQGKRYVGLF